ncbi:MAG: Fe-S-containing hydro-lyase [Anaerolineae bacterium]|nr:Fe-S-containing hydro-lyase [Anaerolineae bacterium]
MRESQYSPIHLPTPISDEAVATLHVGDQVLLSGVIYTARDAAHKRLTDAVSTGQTLPFALQGQVIYYVGPAPARPGEVTGPAGPTTSTRVDPYTPLLLAHGLKGMIGKGKRSQTVREAIATYRAVYFVAVGGAAALIADRIKRVDLVAYPDLGTEAIYRMEVQDFPLVVGNDVHGGDLFEQGRAAYRREG